MEIDQLSMATSPQTVAAEVAAFVDFDPEQTRRFMDALTAGRPQLTGQDAATVLHSGDLQWSAEEWTIFNTVCAPVMKRFGYAMDESYRPPLNPAYGQAAHPH
jgi:hypothetical protein